MRALALAVAALACAACSSSGSGTEAPLETPAGLQATAVPGDLDLVRLSWTSPRTEDGLEVQVRRGGGDWVTQPYQVPSSGARLVIALPPDAPELTTFGLRARALRGTQATAWGPEVSFQRGVRPAGDLALSVHWEPYLGQVVKLTWTRRSAVADRVTLERQIQPASGVPGPWTPLAVAPGETSHRDVDPPGWQDFARCAYRATYWAGAVASEPVEVLSDPGGLAAPRDLAVALSGGADARVSWTNASTAATRIEVLGSTWGSAQRREWTLAPDATSVDDPGLAPGVHQYYVWARSDAGFGVVSSAAETVAIVPAASHASTYPVQVVGLPGATAVARRSDGTYAAATAGNPGGGPSYLFAPDGEAWDRFATPPGVWLASPGPLVDAAGGLHAIYQEDIWEGASRSPVRHVWRDGAGWHTELVGLAPYGGVTAAIASDGSVHVVWGLADDQGFAYATNAGGAFAVEEVRPAGGAPVVVASAPALDGPAPRLLVVDAHLSPVRTWLASRDGGTWTTELVPGATAGPDAPWSLLAGRGALAWIYPRWNGGGYDLLLRERTGGGWGGEELLVSSTPTFPAPGIGAALSPDGTRIALALPGRDFRYPTEVTRLAVRSGGTTTLTELLPSAAAVQVGFTSGGKVWLLDGLRSPGGVGETVPYALYEEQ